MTVHEEDKAEIVIGWIVLLLVMKNAVLLIFLAVLRRRGGIYRAPEDLELFHGQQNVNEYDDWSFAGRINRCLRNDLEYVPYFLILSMLLFWQWQETKTPPYIVYNHIFTRSLIYGITMVVSRYLHNLCYIFRITYGRILGFLLTVCVLVAMSIDNCYGIMKGHNRQE